MLSDINAGTRDYIISIDQDMYDQVEKEALGKILELKWDESIKKDIEDTLNSSKKEEDLIIQAARKYSALFECKVNSKVYEDTFEIPIKIIETELHVLSQQVSSLSLLLKNENYKRYLSHIRRLSHSIRWSWENRLVPISVMAHLVIVGIMSYFIAHMEQKSVSDLKTMLYTALYHDIPEAITWDIISPVKNSIPGFAHVIEEAEKRMLDDYLFCFIEKSYKEKISSFMLHPFENETGKLVKYADILSALYEAKIEVLFGNTRDYESICHKLEEKMISVDKKSIHYLLKNWLLEFNEKNIVQ